MTVYTSYFAKIGALPDNFILFSIAGKSPDWFTIGETGRYRSLPMLFPKYVWWKEWHDKFGKNPESDESKSFYISKYKETVLDRVNVGFLTEILAGCGGTPCLLCYERPFNFCHRHLVSDFLNEHGIESKEIIL